MTGGHDQFHDLNVKAVMDKMTKRAEAGYRKYGRDTTRNDFDLSRWLSELQEEMLDAVVYLEAALNKLDKGEHSG